MILGGYPTPTGVFNLAGVCLLLPAPLGEPYVGLATLWMFQGLIF